MEGREGRGLMRDGEEGGWGMGGGVFFWKKEYFIMGHGWDRSVFWDLNDNHIHFNAFSTISSSLPTSHKMK